MTARTPTYLKGRFENGDTPSGTDFEDLVDSFIPVLSSGKITINNPVEVSGDFTAQRVWADTINASAFNVNVFNAAVVSASTMNANIMNAQYVSASSINGITIQGTTVSGVNVNANTMSANVANINVGNITTVSGSVANYNMINAQVVSASVGRFIALSAGVVDSPYVLQSIQSVSASGTVEAQGTISSAAYVRVIDASSNARVLKLETFRRGFRQTIINDTNTTCDVYPPNGTIDGVSALQVAPSARRAIVHFTSTTYYSGV